MTPAPGFNRSRRRAATARVLPLFALVAVIALPAALLRAHHPVHPARGRPVITLDSGAGFSLSAARAAADAGSPPGSPALRLRLQLSGGGKGTWVSESCNPVVPVINGEARPLRQCFANFYATVALTRGRGKPVEFLLPIANPQRPLKAGDRVQLMMALGSDCKKTGGPGLFALGNCKVTEQILSAPFIIKE